MPDMHRDPKLTLLRGLPGMGACATRELTVLARLLDQYEVAPGTVLAREGGVGRDVYVVVKGEAEVRRAGTLLWELGPGDVVGELGLLQPAPAATTVTARTGMRLLALSPRGRTAVFELPSVAMWVWGQLVGRMRDALGAPQGWPGTPSPATGRGFAAMA